MLASTLSAAHRSTRDIRLIIDSRQQVPVFAQHGFAEVEDPITRKYESATSLKFDLQVMDQSRNDLVEVLYDLVVKVVPVAILLNLMLVFLIINLDLCVLVASKDINVKYAVPVLARCGAQYKCELPGNCVFVADAKVRRERRDKGKLTGSMPTVCPSSCWVKMIDSRCSSPC